MTEASPLNLHFTIIGENKGLQHPCSPYFTVDFENLENPL